MKVSFGSVFEALVLYPPDVTFGDVCSQSSRRMYIS